MAQSKAEYIKQIVSLIKEKKIMRVDHIFGQNAPIGKSRFYQLCLHEVDDIKEALSNNRYKGVDYLLQKWMASDNATLQIAAMRLICDPDEHRKLNQQYNDITTQGEKIQITFESGSKD